MKPNNYYALRVNFLPRDVCLDALVYVVRSLGSCGCTLSRGPNSSHFVGITYSYVELLLRLCQFAECHRTLNFHDTHTSLPITIAEEHKHARLKVEVGVRLALEAIHRVEGEHTWLVDEVEEHLVEEARLKAEEEEQAR